MNLCCVWNSLVWDCGSECVLCVRQFGAWLEKVRLCFVCENLERDWGIDFVLCVGEFGSGLGE